MSKKELLEEQSKKLDGLNTDDEWSNWRTETLPIISAIYGQKSAEYEQFTNLGWYSASITNTINDSKNMLNGCIRAMAIHSSKKSSTASSSNKNAVNVYNNPTFSQSQNQTQALQLDLDLKDILEDELPRTRMKEIDEIIQSKEPKESKLQKIGEVLKKTGVEVVSSTLAKVITANMGLPS